jgi:hypothetical protein
MLARSGIQSSHGRIQKMLYRNVFADRKSRNREKLVQGGAVNVRAVGMVVIGMRVMFVPMRGLCRSVMFVRSKRDLFAASPCRGDAGEKDQQTATDDNQAFHLLRVNYLASRRTLFQALARIRTCADRKPTRPLH